MKKSQLIILAAVLAGLIVVNGFQKIISEKAAVKKVQKHEEWHPFVPKENVSRILFSKAGSPDLQLLKEGETWKVETLSGVQADSQKIAELMNLLNEVKAEIRAEGEELYPRFGVTDQESFRIQILNAEGGAIIDFFMGAKRAGKGVFIRLPGKAKIYSVAEDLPTLFGLFGDLGKSRPLPIFFADLRLVPETFEQIQRFETTQFQEGNKKTLAALERPSTEAGTPWKFLSENSKFSVSPEKVEDYLSKIIATQAENIAVGASIPKVEYEIMLRDGRGKVLRLEFSKQGQHWLVRRENTAFVFEISSRVFEDLQTEDIHFAIDNPLQIRIDEASTVELVEGKKTETFSKESGWPSAAAIMDAASRLQFLSVVPDVQAKDLAEIPPTHQLHISQPGVPAVDLHFYFTSPELTEIKTVVSGQDAVFLVSRAFFDSIFVPATPPVSEKPAA